MYLAWNGKNIPEEWTHDPTITDNKQNTVAMFSATSRSVIQEVWRHDPLL